MNEKRELLFDEEPKHKKKSKSKGQPRANHKHVYETVLLSVPYRFNLGSERTVIHLQPTDVCTICGRIAGTNWDPSYYLDNSVFEALAEDRLTDKSLNLPKWQVEDFMDKFATPTNEIKENKS